MWGDSRYLPGIGGTSCRRLTQLQTPSPGRFSWRHQLREFQSRFHVVAVDLRGYGPSDAPKDVNCYTVDLLLADIKDVILGLGMSQCPIQKRPLPLLPSSPHLCPFWDPLPYFCLTPTTSYTVVSPRVLQVHPCEP